MQSGLCVERTSKLTPQFLGSCSERNCTVVVMATVCAHINLLGLTTPTSKSCSSCNNVVSQAAGVVNFRLQQGASVRSGYLQGLACRASSGGSRRDYEKIVARTQKRRPRKIMQITISFVCRFACVSIGGWRFRVCEPFLVHDEGEKEGEEWRIRYC